MRVSQVNILDENGNVSWAAKWTRAEVQAIEDFQGYRSFQKEYMNNPIVEGAVFRQEWIRWAKRPQWRQFEEIVLYIDPSWKGSTKNDYKAAKLWGKVKGGQLWHLRAFVRQATVAEMVRWCYDLYEWAQATGVAIKFYMEANFMQDMLMDDFTKEGDLRGYQLPIIGDKRKSPTSSSVLRPPHRCGSAALSFTTRAKRTTPTCCAALTRRWHSKRVCAATMMRQTLTSRLLAYCKNTLKLQTSRRLSESGETQKM